MRQRDRERERESGEGSEGSGGCRLSGGRRGVFGAPFFVAGTPGRGEGPQRSPSGWLVRHANLPEERLQVAGLSGRRAPGNQREVAAGCRRVWPEPGGRG